MSKIAAGVLEHILDHRPSATNDTPKPTFERLADATIERCQLVYRHRGTQYGDNWAQPSFVTMRAVASKLGYELRVEHLRAIAFATLVDIKHQRMLGGYNDDSLIDGINYAAVLAEEMKRLSIYDKPRKGETT